MSQRTPIAAALGHIGVLLVLVSCGAPTADDAISRPAEPVGSASLAASQCVTVQRGTLGDTADTFINSAIPGDGSEGGYLAVYTGGTSAGEKRSLIRFDLGFIPSTASIDSAKLTLYQTYKPTGSAVRVHRVTEPWSEATTSWTTFGDAFDVQLEGALLAGSGFGPRSVDLTALVQRWVDGDAPNHGVLLEEDPNGQTPWRSSEATYVSERPALTVCWTDAACTPACSGPGEICQMGQCVECAAGHMDCDGDPANGCEVDVQNDASQCGACGHSCLGGACTAGACGPVVLLANGGNVGNDIAVDATSIYWTARSGSLGGSVMRANKDGSGATPLISGITCPSDGGPSRIAIDDDHVYVTNYRCDNVMRVGKDGTGPTTLLTFPPGSGADYVVVSDDRIYVGLYFANKIMVANKDGSGLATLASSPTGRTVTMAIHGSDMFWTGFFGGPMLQRVSLGGGAITTLVPSGDGYGMALDADDVFIGTLGGALLKLPGGAGAPVQLASGTGWVDGIVPDEEHVYWSNAGNPGTIRRANKDGSGAVTLVAGLDMPFAMAADGEAIYWTHFSNAFKLMKLAK